MIRRHAFGRDLAFFVALMSVALLLGPALAHAFALPNKIDMTRETYFAAQRAYDGWSQVAYLISVEFTGLLAVIIIYRRERRVLVPAAIALACAAAAQIVFWAFTFPANVATENWTAAPENWEALRAFWEYSHLAGAILQIFAMAALIVAVLRRACEPAAKA